MSAPLSILDREECPAGVPLDVWTLFVREADAVRQAGFTRYGARTILETLRHHERVNRGNREFKVDNDWQRDLSRSYMRMRGCYSFFEIRERKAA